MVRANDAARFLRRPPPLPALRAAAEEARDADDRVDRVGNGDDSPAPGLRGGPEAPVLAQRARHGREPRHPLAGRDLEGLERPSGGTSDPTAYRRHRDAAGAAAGVPGLG